VLSEERRQAILQLLDTRGNVTVAELGAQFEVSEMTIRRDLDDLECKGLLRRVHGGAVRGRGRSYEPAFLVRSGLHQAEKERIAAAAVDLVQNGDSIALDVGTTTLEIAKRLKGKRDLTVITPSLRIANQLSEMQDLRLVLPGGLLRPGELSLVGSLAEETFRQFFVDKMFMGIGGIDLDAGLTEFNLEDALVKKAMLRAAKEIIIVADASKFGVVAFSVVAPLEVVSRIVTDNAISPLMVDTLRERNIEVIVV